MHRLAQVNITNFRSCRSVELSLDDCTAIVGYNNAGKSNIIGAIEWVLNPRPLSPKDFFAADEPVIVEAQVKGLDEAVLALLNDRHRAKIKPFIADGTLSFRHTQSTPGGSKKDLDLKIFDPAATDTADPWRPYPTGIPEAIKALFPEPIIIGAMEDAAEDSTKSKAGTTINKLLAEFTAPLEAAHGEEIQTILNTVSQYLAVEGNTRAEELKRFDREASDALALFFPGVQIHLDIPVPEVRALFRGGTIRVSEKGRDTIRGFTDLGHGAQRSIQMGLIRYLADLRGQGPSSAQRRLLLVEEPELFLHPQAIEQVRRAFETLSGQGYQVVYATHSPIMITRHTVPSTRIVRKDPISGETKVMATLKQALERRVADEDNRLYILMDLRNASAWLFSDRVLLAEGNTEMHVFPALYEAATGRTLAHDRIALMSVGSSSGIKPALEVLKDLGISSCGLVDFDYAMNQGVQQRLIEPSDGDLTACLAQIRAMAASDPAIHLGSNGRPTNQGAKKAAAVYCEWAKSAVAKPIAKALHAKLKCHHIWLWIGGDIEHHVGLPGKKQPEHWAPFRRRLEADGFDATVADPIEVRSCINWLQARTAPIAPGV